MNVNHNAIVVVALLMGTIYFSAYMVYGESSDWDRFERMRGGVLDMPPSIINVLTNGTNIVTFEYWINSIYIMTKIDIIDSNDRLTPWMAYYAQADKSWIINPINKIKLDYHWGTGENLFDKYPTGYDWWANSPYLDEKSWLVALPFSNFRYDIKNVWYPEYINDVDPEEEVAEYLDTTMITDWVDKAGMAVSVGWSMLTLHIIPDGEEGMPNLLKSAMLVFLIPMWIILLLGIAPLFFRFGELIIQGIDAIIPG